MPQFKTGLPRPAGAGRKVGTPNKATSNAREAIARLVDDNAENLSKWLEEIHETEGAHAAWGCMMDVLEFYIPKLQRTEIKQEAHQTLRVMWVDDDDIIDATPGGI